MAILSYHAGDAFEVPDGVGRIHYYRISSIPTAVFNGTDWVVGGGGGAFDLYKTLWNQHMTINTPGVLSLKVEYDSSGHTGNLITKFHAVDQILESDLHLRYAITESHKYHSWQWLDSLHFIARDMLPDSMGLAFSLAQGETLADTQSFSVLPGWTDRNCELVAFVQSDKDSSVLISNSIPLYQTHVSGDANGDGAVTVSDVVYLTNHILYSGPGPEPSAAGDPTEDCIMDSQDVVYVYNYLFHQGPAPLRGWEID